jgi:hypothetical protein
VGYAPMNRCHRLQAKAAEHRVIAGAAVRNVV